MSAGVPAPAERSARAAERAVIEGLRPWLSLHQHAWLPEMAAAVLTKLAENGLLTPGDVVVRDARALGLGVLVDGEPVEPERVHLVRPADAERRDSVAAQIDELMGRYGSLGPITWPG